jgi:hypothetical protein
MALAAIVKRCLEFPIERPAYSELERWNAAIGARPAFAVAIGAKLERIDTGGVTVGDVKRFCHQINTVGLTIS